MRSLRDKHVLITGGAGFIGSRLAEALVEDNAVTVLDDLSTGTRDAVPAEATFIKGDVRVGPLVEKQVDDADIVFHEAAIVSVERSIDDPVTAHSVTVDGTLNVLEAARQHSTRVVLASSAAVYGPPATVPVAEDAPKRPTSPYGLDKLTADRYARLYHDLYGIETVALRFFNVYGPGQPAGDYSGVITVFLEQARAGDPLTVHGDGTQTRDFVHVDDVVRATLAAATTEAVGEAYNVGTGTATSIDTLAATIRDLTGADSPIVHTDPRPGDIEQSRADTARAADRLGFEAEIDLADGLRTLLDEPTPA